MVDSGHGQAKRLSVEVESQSQPSKWRLSVEAESRFGKFKDILDYNNI